MSPRGAITGDVWSWTVTVKVVSVAWLPWASVAEQVTVVVALVVAPTRNVLPEAGEQAAVPAPSTASVVVGLV